METRTCPIYLQKVIQNQNHVKARRQKVSAIIQQHPKTKPKEIQMNEKDKVLNEFQTFMKTHQE